MSTAHAQEHVARARRGLAARGIPPEGIMYESFAFVDAGRTFDCSVEPLRRQSTEAWWWFRVSSEQHQRFAPFRAAPGDTPDVVRGRILAYYDDLLARRAAPATPRWQRRTDGAPRPAVAATSPGEVTA